MPVCCYFGLPCVSVCLAARQQPAAAPDQGRDLPARVALFLALFVVPRPGGRDAGCTWHSAPRDPGSGRGLRTRTAAAAERRRRGRPHHTPPDGARLEKGRVFVVCVCVCVCLLAQVVPRVLGASVPRRCDLAADDAAAAAALGGSGAEEHSSQHRDDHDDDQVETREKSLGDAGFDRQEMPRAEPGRRGHRRCWSWWAGRGMETGGGGDGEPHDGDIWPSRTLGPGAFNLGALVPPSAATRVARCPVRVWASRCMQLASLLAKESIVGGLAGETGLVLLRGELVWSLVARLMMHPVWWCWLGLEGSRAVHASSWSRSLPQHVRAQEKRILGCRRRMDTLCPGEVRPVPCALCPVPGALWKKPFSKTRWTRDATQC